MNWTELNALLKFEISATRNCKRVTAVCGLRFAVYLMLKVSIIFILTGSDLLTTLHPLHCPANLSLWSLWETCELSKTKVRLFRYIHFCQFQTKVRQYCIKNVVRTTLLSRIRNYKSHIQILIKKIGARTLREVNKAVNILFYTNRTFWARNSTRGQQSRKYIHL